MSIYKQGIERGLEQGLKRGLEQGLERGLEQGLLRGKPEAILELLQELGPVGEALEQRIRSETDTEVLRKLLKLAGKADNIEEFEAQLGS